MLKWRGLFHCFCLGPFFAIATDPRELRSISDPRNQFWLSHYVTQQYSVRLNLQQDRHPPNQRSRNTTPQCKDYSTMKLLVKSTYDGCARIMWSGIAERPEMGIGLIRDETHETFRIYLVKGRSSGTIDTRIPLNSGLQVALYKVDKGFFSSSYQIIHRGPVFDEANGVVPTRMKGFDASLQLYTKGRYACARLYINKSFIDWKYVFKNSWVGFYKSTLDHNDKYKKYQWSINFKKRSNQNDTPDYDIYEYESSLAVGPGLQARFMLEKNYGSEKARTEPWEGYDSRLQLYTRDGYACARLYIKKSYTNWKNVFRNSWVGFYVNSQDNNRSYKTFQWSTKFKKKSDYAYSEDYDIYEFQSILAIAHGVQVRLMLDKGYDEERVRTEPWEGLTNLPSNI
ncbi:hypothetical protein P4O66_012451 [Electrophorus voltai]|uniref:Uncharacterized protein n=1 Tax=Electrophorus voltai TaxID=2609070 RepID=A0AAD8Z6M3_9TELE|nr:hypothetical protein P4O66_012451 [Electrophorus voltai]